MKRTYEFENLGCAHCAGKMEEKIGKLPEVESVNLSFPMKKMYVETSSEDLLPVIQKICTDIEPDVIVTEVLKKSSKKEKMKKFMKSTVDAVAKVNMKVMNITNITMIMIMNITIIMTKSTVIAAVVMTMMMTRGQLLQQQNAREMERQRYLLLRNLAVHIVQVKWKNKFHICQELRQ